MSDNVDNSTAETSEGSGKKALVGFEVAGGEESGDGYFISGGVESGTATMDESLGASERPAVNGPDPAESAGEEPSAQGEPPSDVLAASSPLGPPISPGSPIGPVLIPTNPPVTPSPLGPPISPSAPAAPVLIPPNPVQFEPAVALEIITAKWNALGGAPGPAVTPGIFGIERGKDCSFQRFADGVIYRVGTQAFWLRGPILERYEAIGASRSALGRPAHDEIAAQFDSGRRLVLFDEGRIYFTPGVGAAEIQEPYLTYWMHRGGERSFLRYPTHGLTNGQVDFENGTLHLSEFVFSASDARWVTIGPIHVDGAAANARAELILSSSGSWEYKGAMRTTGILSHDVFMTSWLDFQTADGRVFAWAEKGDVEGTLVLGGDRVHRFQRFGMDPALAQNWAAVRRARVRTEFRVDTSVGDVLAVVGSVVGLPVAAIALAVVGSLAAQNTKMCGWVDRERYDPVLGDFVQSRGVVIVGKNDPCPEGTIPP